MSICRTPIYSSRNHTIVRGAADDQISIFNVDLLRGIAALSVLIWHYQHFFYPQAGVILADRNVQPLYLSLRWLYDYGGHGVQFFWIISGFVFFHAYQAREQLSLRQFAINRFSRLYPLHLVTLVLVGLLQFVSFQFLGHYQIYPINDLYHFFLNLFMVSHWGFQRGWAFNAPIWSVSVEIVIYSFFFAYMRSIGIHLISAIAWFAFTWIAFQGMNSANMFSQCALLFILGGLVHEFQKNLCQRLPAWICTVFASVLLLIAAYSLFSKAAWIDFWIYFGLFPALIWLFASFEHLGISSGKAGQVIGNITYASYLIHVPIQIAIMTAIDVINLDRLSIVKSPLFLGAYLTTVCLSSYWIFQRIELPLKQIIRKRLLSLLKCD